jgi:hypothetical protein
MLTWCSENAQSQRGGFIFVRCETRLFEELVDFNLWPDEVTRLRLPLPAHTDGNRIAFRRKCVLVTLVVATNSTQAQCRRARSEARLTKARVG